MSTMMSCEQVERLLDAYLDGEVAATDAQAIDAHLSTCEACASSLRDREAIVARVRALRPFDAPAALRTRVAGLVGSPVGALGARVDSRGALTHARAPLTRAIAWTAALAAAMLIGVAIGRSAWTSERTHAVADAVVDAHLRSLMATHLYDVESTDRHTVKPWFAGRLDFSPTVPDLTLAGFPLAGGRIDYVASHVAAALVYRRGAHVINVFVWPSTETNAAPERSSDPRGYHLIQWTQARLAYWVVSDVAATDLDAFVATFRAAL